MTAQRWAMFPVLYCYWLKCMLKKYCVQQTKKLVLLLSVQRNAEEVNQIILTLVIDIVLYIA